MISGCSSNQKSEDLVNEYKIQLPNQVKLTYEEIRLEQIQPYEEYTGWRKMSSLPFGEFSDQPITIDLYTTKKSQDVNGILHFEGNTYLIKDLGYAHDLNSIETYIIQEHYKTDNEYIIFVGGIGNKKTFSLKYLFFNVLTDEWMVYQNWGIPKVVDLNQDGVKEIIVQFDGLHAHLPNINILKRKDGKFEVADIQSSILEHMDPTPPSIKLEAAYQHAEHQHWVDVSIFGLGNLKTGRYLLKINELKLMND